MSNASDPRELARVRRTDRARVHREREDMRWVLSDQKGRRAMWAIMASNRLHGDIPVGSSETYTAIGQRSVALAVMRLVKAVGGPRLLAEMELEWDSPPELTEPED